ncbi:hypothetical protein A3Q56_01976 [Intoshia linei]|uniref:NADH dehydrogenase [ubiquinone] 1 beta subcomplex subunit 9 n=1 Tax=Intoshia linei TaxID=1819745 RepID=A0A177B806_9BILA|nr:hypothetical protein A3Q56_01976 [Intoshia linei]
MYQTKFVSHSRRVCKLYKDALHALREIYNAPHECRYHSVLLRQRFEKYKNEKDLMLAKKMVIEGEAELKSKRSWDPLKYAHSPGGAAYDTEFHWSDSLLDSWHPIEKMAYAKYFEKREIRKGEYIENWNKTYENDSK